MHKMIATVASAFVALCGLAAAYTQSSLVVTRQDSANVGYIEKYETDYGKIEGKAALNFTFDWPLVEMTTDHNNRDVYAVTYPDTAPGAVLYQLDENLKLKYAWEHVDYSFFDLQFSSKQKAMYGILVTSSYGRALSNFTLDQKNDNIVATELYTLPYMWYVNASSFDTENSRFFALINNFPGFENSTLDQQLIVADFSQQGKPQVGLFPISSGDLLVQFIAYDSYNHHLYCSGMNFKTGKVELAALDATNGKVGEVLLSWPGVNAGPLSYFPSSSHGEEGGHATLFVQTHLADAAKGVESTWELRKVELKDVKPRYSVLVNTYKGKNFQDFAAATAQYKSDKH